MRTTDLYLASALDASGHRPTGVERDGHRAVFVFDDTPEVEATVEAFFNRDLTLDASTYAERIRQFKGRVMAVKEGRVGA